MHYRYRQLLLAGSASGLSAIVSSMVLSSVPSGPLRLVVALLPVPFFVAFIVAELRWVRVSDEFHQKVMLDSLAIAFPAAIALAVIVEAIQKAGYAKSWTIGEVWPWMALLWIPALWIASRRFR